MDLDVTRADPSACIAESLGSGCACVSRTTNLRPPGSGFAPVLRT